MKYEVEKKLRGPKRGWSRLVGTSASGGVVAVTPWREKECDALADAEKVSAILKSGGKQ